MKEKEKVEKRKLRQSSGVCTRFPTFVKLSEKQLEDIEILIK